MIDWTIVGSVAMGIALYRFAEVIGKAVANWYESKERS